MCTLKDEKYTKRSLNLDFNLYMYMKNTQGTVKSLRVKLLKLDSNYIKTNCHYFLKGCLINIGK